MSLEQLEAHFQTLDRTIQRVGESSTIYFENLEALKQYLRKEAEFWRNHREGDVGEICGQYQGLLQQFDSILAPPVNAKDSYTKNTLAGILNTLRNKRINLVQSDSVLGKWIADEYVKNQAIANGIYAYHAKKIDKYSIENFDKFIGIIKAYLLTDGLKALGSEPDKRIEQLENHAKSYDDVLKGILAKAENTLKDIEAERQNRIKDFDATSTEKFGAFDKRFKEQEDQHASLSQTYEEYLRLKGPARYWNELAKDYEEKGSRWRNWTIGISAVFICGLVAVLYQPPLIYDIAQEFWSSKNIKGTIVSAIIVSTFAYLVQFTIKLSLSSFHLSRDAKERAQLTYFYLAMLKKGALQDYERGVVMQSLFSRSDTGLLKNDAGPTMPTNVMDTLKPNKQGNT